MMVALMCLDDKGAHHYLDLDKGPVVIGRCPNAGAPLTDPEVSRRHCEVSRLDGALVVRDLGSTNGTFVNGSRVAEAVLKSGDRLAIGRTEFVVQYESSRVGAPA
jgi:adenylate cyclase